MTGTTLFFKLKVISPIHIGCDEVYEPTGFVVDEQTKTLIAFSPADFLGSLEEEDLESFSRICRKGSVESLLEIYKFIRQHKQHARGRRIAVSDAFVRHYDKTLKLQPARVQQELNKFLVVRTAFQIKDSVPYLPGSAIKGALRTAVLNLRNKEHSRSRYRSGKELNETLAGGTFDTDPFRFVKVSDFYAENEVRQRVVYGVNRKKQPSEKEARGPYQIMEVIEEGSAFIGSITVNQPDKGANISAPATFEEIRRAIVSFYGMEHEKEQLALRHIGCDTIKSKGGEATSMIRIGRHSGAECVTVEGHRDIKIMQGPGVKPKNLDHATTVWLAADSEKQTTNANLRPFGWAEFSILSDEETRCSRQARIDNYKTWESEQAMAIFRFNEQVAAFAEKQELERLEQQRLAKEREDKEWELRNFPWRTILPSLENVADWGALKTQVLEQADFLQYQVEKEVGEAVLIVATRVATAGSKKWDHERDTLVAQWLQPSGIVWQPLAVSGQNQENPLLGRINNFKTPADYDRALDISSLDLACCRALLPIFKQWGWDKKKKAKPGNHKLWQLVQERLQELK